MYIVCEGEFYSDEFRNNFVVSFKKKAIDICKKDGYKYNKLQDLWLKKSYSSWRRIKKIEYRV